jgi:cell division septation protein DedD
MILVSCCLLACYVGCTQPAAKGGVETEAAPAAEPAAGERQPEQQPTREESPSIYDLEEEMDVEDTPVDPEELEDEIEPLPPDTVSVEEMTAEEATEPRHDLGYRIQVFASSELSKARSMKETVTAKTGYAAYVEYEGGLYKVRVGDFTDRREASAARVELVGLYPDSWIVQTTIRR